MSNTKKLTLSAVMVATALVLTVLSGVLPFRWLQGGEITLASAVPIILVGVLCGNKWGLLSGMTFSIIRILIIGFYPAPTQTLWDNFLVFFLDYLAACTVYGLAGWLYRLMGKKLWAIPVSGAIVLLVRFLCHFISGCLIWGGGAEEGQSVAAFSLAYNGSYMIPETVITVVVLVLLLPAIKKWVKES